MMGTGELLAELPHHNLHPQVTPDTLDEMLDPSIHALQLEHEEEIDAEVEDGDAKPRRRKDKKRDRERDREEDDHDDDYDDYERGHDEL